MSWSRSLWLPFAVLLTQGCSGPAFTPNEGGGGSSATGGSAGGGRGGSVDNPGGEGGTVTGGTDGEGGTSSGGTPTGGTPTGGTPTGGAGASSGTAGEGGSDGGSAGTPSSPFGNAVNWVSGCGQESNASPTTLFSTDAFTVELWLKLESNAPMWHELVWRGGNAGEGPAGWSLELALSDQDTYRPQFCGGADAVGTGGWDCVASADALTVGVRYHIAVVREPPGSGCTNNGLGGCVRFYRASLDEPGVFAHAENIVPFDVTWATAEPLRVAAANADCDLYNTIGVMDELRLWSSARSRSEIDAAAKTALTCAEPALVSNYAFDELDGTRFASCTEDSRGGLFGIGDFTRVDSPFDD